jgi:DNA-binding LacI/PurR family transcriptional regulator
MRSRVGSSPLVLIQPDHEMLLSGTGALPDGTIRTDDASGVSQAVLHLLEEGHHDIAYLGAGDGATDRLRRSTARLTLREEADVVMRTFQVGQDGWTTPAATAEIVRGELPGAVICYDDKLALALLDGLRAFGIEVPRDVSVVGFDGIPFAALSNPRLTTVITGAEEMGRLAARMLVGAVTSGQLDAPRVLPVDLVVRESSGPPRKRRPRVRRTLSSMAGGRPAGGGS